MSSKIISNKDAKAIKKSNLFQLDLRNNDKINKLTKNIP